MTQSALLGQLLVARGMISADQLQIALKEQRQHHRLLGKILTQLGFLSDAALREALALQLGHTSVDLASLTIDALAIQQVPKSLALRFLVLPIALDEQTQTLTLAMADPHNLVALDQVRLHLLHPYRLEVKLAVEQEIVATIEQYYRFELSIDGILSEIETGIVDYGSLQEANTEFSQPVVRLMDALLADAVRHRASDIHFEPEALFVRIRYRIDGVLKQVRSLHKSYWPAMVVRLKVMSELNIAETRLPQDGRMSLYLIGRSMDFRVAVQPTVYGENIVLRILDRQKGLLPLDELGLSVENLQTLKLMLARPEGLILVTGPTGSGKTTTLYSLMQHLNTEAVNIMTLEDPVEYPMPMIRQTSINESIKLDFVSGIRAMMRQDPDIILVGEVRDLATAEMAFRAAMTGHQVFSTLHTNSAVGVFPRLLDLGLMPDVLANHIIGVVAQRLLRRLCPLCKEAYAASSMEKTLLRVPQSEPLTLYRAMGCAHCAGAGYKGRFAAMEILRMDADLDALVVARQPAAHIKQVALQKGMCLLADDALRYVHIGHTSLDEVARVVDLTDRVG